MSPAPVAIACRNAQAFRRGVWRQAIQFPFPYRSAQVFMTTMRVPPASVYFPPEDRAAILQQIDECLATGQLTLGKLGRQLEERFAAYVGADHAVAVNSGTSAIEIPLRAIGVEGKEVLVAANTFFATAAAAIAAGASHPVRRLRPADDGGRPGGAAQRHRAGHRRRDRRCTSAAWSRPTSPSSARSATTRACGCSRTPPTPTARPTTARWRARSASPARSPSTRPRSWPGGEGGIIVTNDERVADEARIYRDQGKASFLTNLHTRLGYNWRMSEPHAAIALSQFAPARRVHRPPPARRGALRRGARVARR